MKTNEILQTWYYTVSVKEEDYEKVIKWMQENWIEWFRLWDNPWKSLIYLDFTLDTIGKVDALLSSGVEIKSVNLVDFSWYDRENFWII